MNIIAGNRQSGRTTKLIHEFINDPNGLLIVHNNLEKTRISHRYHISKKCIFTYNDLLGKHNFITPKRNLYIDNLDMFLEYILGHQGNIKLATILSTKVTKVDEVIDYPKSTKRDSFYKI